jgi:hypothetical protein
MCDKNVTFVTLFNEHSLRTIENYYYLHLMTLCNDSERHCNAHCNDNVMNDLPSKIFDTLHLIM